MDVFWTHLICVNHLRTSCLPSGAKRAASIKYGSCRKVPRGKLFGCLLRLFTIGGDLIDALHAVADDFQFPLRVAHLVGPCLRKEPLTFIRRLLVQLERESD